MNYYLIEQGKPDDRLRHYKNSRVANYTLKCLNDEAGFEKYAIISSDAPVITVRTSGMGYDVNPFAARPEFLE